MGKKLFRGIPFRNAPASYINLRRFPYYIFLLPVFFVLHSFSTYKLYFEPGIFFRLSGIYCLGSAVLFILFSLLTKNQQKAGMISFTLLLVYFFFPYCHVQLKQLAPHSFISSYSVLLPALTVLLFFIIRMLWKRLPAYNKVRNYLHLLFILFLIWDGVTIIKNMAQNTLQVASAIPSLKPCPDCPKPDIYFLLFDEYSSSLSLKNEYHYDNSSIDSFLQQKGFHISPAATSNYNITPFSLASITNMSYLEVPASGNVNSILYHHASNLIRKNQLIKQLNTLGYKFRNISLFDIDEQKAPLHYYFAPSTSQIIQRFTLFNKLDQDLGWHFRNNKKAIAGQYQQYTRAFENIQSGIDSVKTISRRAYTFPQFIYAHLLLPHYPFLVNKNVRYTASQQPGIPDTSIEAYLAYVEYTNTVIRDLVTTIQANTKNKAIILIMGDHGFRRPVNDTFPHSYFAVQNAVYLPSGDYSGFYDSISAVNQFRVVLNTLFKQQLPLLPDKQYYLKDND